jgi:cell division protein FtsB
MNTHLKLLKVALWEIDNLQKKLAINEPEGWEGSKRRMILKKEIQDFIDKEDKPGNVYPQ